MLLLVHNGEKLVRVKNGSKLLSKSDDLTKSFWKLAEEYPEEIIGWCQEQFKDHIDCETWQEIFHHNLIMASYAVNAEYLPDAIGYIDRLPFINVNKQVHYGTWRMSSDIGGIRGKTLLSFKQQFSGIRDFNFLINSIAKVGQQNGLFCYSAPKLLKEGSYNHITENENESTAKASTKQLFSFVSSHYNRSRLLLLFWCYIKYENILPLYSFLNALMNRKLLGKEIHLPSLEPENPTENYTQPECDVIIPTLGRPEYLLQVIEDLSRQTLIPKKVIIIEQNPDKNSISELSGLYQKDWPFEVIHRFTHDTGACYARNLAIEQTSSEWIFFADDDNRMDIDILEKAFKEIYKYQLDCLTLHYPQRGEERIFEKIKQWGTFGAGNSILSKRFASNIKFDRDFEFGYGEDKDYGMQLRNAGCDIIYHPDIQILHLKAPRGGFRQKTHVPWEKDKPKPSPTLMLYAKKHFSEKQMQGFKEELFIKFYFKQDIKNPFRYYKNMLYRWESSEQWGERIVEKREKIFQNCGINL